MTNPIHPMNAHGYKMPIPRSPAVIIDVEEEDIPSPYAYHIIMVPDDREALKARFMQACNQKRWQHIHNAEVKVKSPK